jgi:hypothetical protein
MRRLFIASVSMFAILTAAAVSPAPAQQLPTPPRGFQPPPPAPVKPYTAIAVTPPEDFNDPSFEAFRKNLAAVVQKKERAALAKLIVAQGFFWLQDKDLADSGKPGIDNLAKAIGLDGANATGWDTLASEAQDPTAMAVPQQKGLFCAPAPPTFDAKALGALMEQTGTDPSEWGYPEDEGTELRGAAQPNAPVVEKLGNYFVRVLPDSGPQFLHIALPDGKSGYVATDALAPLIADQICYTKDAGGWKIAGYIGGIAQDQK